MHNFFLTIYLIAINDEINNPPINPTFTLSPVFTDEIAFLSVVAVTLSLDVTGGVLTSVFELSSVCGTSGLSVDSDINFNVE